MRVVKLSGHPPLAEGSRRLVFQHPEDDDLLIKVVKPDSYGEDGQPIRRKFYKARRREGVFIYHLRELSEYLAARVSNRSPEGLPINAVYGLVETDLGLGLTVEKVRGRNGGLARTLRELVEERDFNRDLANRFETFIQDMIQKHVVVHELSADNVVLAEDGNTPRRFMCVDGIGSRTLIPIKKWSRWANARKILKFRSEVLRTLADKFPTFNVMRFAHLPPLLLLCSWEGVIGV